MEESETETAQCGPEKPSGHDCVGYDGDRARELLGIWGRDGGEAE